MKEYLEAAARYMKANGVTPTPHIQDVVANVMMERDGVRFCGTFAKAVVNNNLEGVISFGDAECLANLRIIYLASRYAHIG